MRSVFQSSFWVCILGLMLVTVSPKVALAQQAGVLSGVVSEGLTKDPLIGATVRLQNTSYGAVTDLRGRYRLAGVPAGTYTATFAYIGYKSETRTVTIVDGQTVELNVALDVVAVTTEEIVVMGQLQGQSRALNNQAASNKIVNIVDAERIGEFPDQNAAEAVARIPGVALRRDGGEGQKLIIRGLDPNLSSATINGERIPGTAGGVDGNRLQDVGRSASLSFIPPDMIKTIEVFKALTPDQDADAIGGTVNFITRNAKEGLQFNANGRWGYHFLDRDPTMYQFNAFGSNRFLDGKLGAVFTASYQRANRSAESYDAGYIQTVDSLPLNDLRIVDRVEYRSRLGLSGAIDVDLGGGSELVLRGNYGSTNRDAIERRTRYFTAVAGNSSRALNRDIRDRRITTDLINLSVSGKHIFGAPELDYQFSFSRSGSDQPTSTSVAFQLSNALAPQIRTAGNIGIADVQQFAYDTTRFGSARANGANGFLYTFPVLSGNVFQTFNSADRDFAGRANFKLPLTLSNNATGYIKFGGMFRTKVRDSFVNEISLSAPRTDSLARAFGLVGPTENVRFSTFIDSSFADSDFLNGRFFLDRSFNLSRVNDFFLNQVPRSLYNTIEVRDVLNYVARENVGGGYMMGEFNIGDNLMVLGGLRYEFTAVDAQGVYGIISQVNSQRFGSRVDSTVQTNYGALFPMFHLRYRFQPQTELRLAVTRTLSRPNYYDVVPYEEVLFGESTIRRGNPNLQPTLSWNFDAMFSQYLGNVGILSFGAFHKRIDNYIYQVSTIELRFNEDGDEVPFIIRTPTNASFSRIWGVMRTNGIDERYCTGNASDWEKFEVWAKTVPKTLRNPLYHWTHLELARYFGITDRLLNADTAASIWSDANAQLPTLTTQAILKKMNVRVVCTTDDPTDTLEHHAALAKQTEFPVKVLPTFRPDKILFIENTATWNAYVDKLSATSNLHIASFQDALAALRRRHDFFAAHGCRLSDSGIDTMFAEDFTEREVSTIFEQARSGKAVSPHDALKYKSAVMLELGLMNHEKKWTQQFHIGAMRNNNSRMMRTLGADSGFDSIGDLPIAYSLAKYLNTLDDQNKLAKTILYNLNPRDNEVFATMIGNFQDGTIAGKLQYGSAWWFLDQKDGMEKQMNALSNMGLLSRFVGMVTDSRSFLSYPRHEYFRRTLCNLLGADMEAGLLPNDFSLIGDMVRDICYRNAERYFGFLTD